MAVSTYTIAPKPKFADFTAYDCACCGREELKRPVFLACGGSVAAYGSGCAAVLLYGNKSKASVKRATDAQTLADSEARNWAAEADRVAKFFARQGELTREDAVAAYAKRNPSVWNRVFEPDVLWTDGVRWFGWCEQKCAAFADRLAELNWRRA